MCIIYICLQFLISVMSYKVYNGLSGVGLAATALISVIYYNVYNVME